MEKLIELLNEFENEEADANIRYWNYYQNWFHLLEYWQTYSEMLIISKKYEFIKWLVENDKIDKSKVFSFIDTADKPYEDILCLLALSDEPISDLISYLK